VNMLHIVSMLVSCLSLTPELLVLQNVAFDMCHLKQNDATSKTITLMMYHQENSATTIHSSVWYPTIPDTWNTKIVVGKVISAVNATTTWQNIVVIKSNVIELRCCKGLEHDPSYLIPIEVNSRAMRMV